MQDGMQYVLACVALMVIIAVGWPAMIYALKKRNWRD